jgi:hypothetical protein
MPGNSGAALIQSKINRVTTFGIDDDIVEVLCEGAGARVSQGSSGNTLLNMQRQHFLGRHKRESCSAALGLEYVQTVIIQRQVCTVPRGQEREQREQAISRHRSLHRSVAFHHELSPLCARLECSPRTDFEFERRRVDVRLVGDRGRNQLRFQLHHTAILGQEYLLSELSAPKEWAIMLTQEEQLRSKPTTATQKPNIKHLQQHACALLTLQPRSQILPPNFHGSQECESFRLQNDNTF